MTSRRRSRRGTVIAGIAGVAGFVAVVVWTSLEAERIECEVCLTYRGRETCRTVSAANAEEGIRGATDNACALLASGVTETLRCTRTPPRSASCR